MTFHNYGRPRYGYQDVGAKTTRFDDAGRMDDEELDEAELRRLREEAWRSTLPPVRPEREIEFHGGKISMYTGEAEAEMRRRQAQLSKIRTGAAR